MKAQNVTISFSRPAEVQPFPALVIPTDLHKITIDFADASDIERIVEALAPALGATSAIVSVPSAERHDAQYRIGFAYCWDATTGWDAEEDRSWRRDWKLWESPELWADMSVFGVK